MRCPQCHARNHGEGFFCTRCGARLEQSPPQSQRQSSLGIVPKFLGAVIVLLIFLTVATIWIESPDQPDQKTPRPGTPSFGLEVQLVAAKFLCACGSCDVLELAECTCPTALAEKRLIEQELGQGTPEREVLKQVNQRYGKIKSQYASLVAGDGESTAKEATQNVR